MQLKLGVVILFLFSLNSYASHICYISLNNQNEFLEMDKLMSKLNKYSKDPITVKEYLAPGGNPEKAFEKMVKSGDKCDGLVISGHHTGSFGGKNASGSLDIDFMEKLSCKDEYKSFFNNIKGLWLQGCRTLGVGKIEAYEDVDYHMNRVGAVLEEDHLEQSFADLNMEFSATLDQDNPLSSRYLRVFPRASIFGWTKTAPGEDSRSEFSVPFHIANLAKLTDDRGRYFDNPVSGQISKESAVKYLDAIHQIIGHDLNATATGCAGGDKSAEHAVEAWLRHGNSPKGWKYSFDNPDLNAYKPLFSSDKEFLKKAKELECYLKNTSSPEELLKVLDEILKNETLIGYSFNSFYEVMQRLIKKGDVESLVKIQDKLKKSELLNHFLMRKLTSKDLGVIRKIDYYVFWKKMTGKGSEEVEKRIRAIFMKMVMQPTKSGDYNHRDFKLTLFQTMVKNELMDADMLDHIITNSTDSVTIEAALRAVDEVKGINESKAIEYYRTIVETKPLTSRSVARIVEKVKYSDSPLIKEIKYEMLRAAINNENCQSNCFLSMTNEYVMDRNKNVDLPPDVVKSMLTHKNLPASFHSRGINVLTRLSKPIENEYEVLHELLFSKKLNGYLRSRSLRALSKSKRPIKDFKKLVKDLEKFAKKEKDYSTIQEIKKLRKTHPDLKSNPLDILNM